MSCCCSGFDAAASLRPSSSTCIIIIAPLHYRCDEDGDENLAYGSLMRLQFEHEVLVVVEPLSHLNQHFLIFSMIDSSLYIVDRDRLKLLLAETVKREKMVFSFEQPRENLQRTSTMMTMHNENEIDADMKNFCKQIHVAAHYCIWKDCSKDALSGMKAIDLLEHIGPAGRRQVGWHVGQVPRR